MDIGVGLDQSLGLSFAQQREMVRRAAQLRYKSAWTPAGLAQDAFHICAQWNSATQDVVPGGIETGIAVVPVSLWSAPVLAATAGTVGELTNGRFILGIGAGASFDAQYQQSFGLPSVLPLALMRDYAVTLHDLLAGQRVDYNGEAVKLHGITLGFHPPRVPIYLGALGPRMLRLAARDADGVVLNWCTPDQIAWSRTEIAEGAERARRNPAEVLLAEYIRVCVDEDREVARRAFTRALLGYALARPGTSKELGYRAHFTRMGFDEALSKLEARRDHGASETELVDEFPPDLALKVGYYGPAAGAAEAFRRLAAGLDLAIVRIVAPRSSPDAVLATIQACRPELEQSA